MPGEKKQVRRIITEENKYPSYELFLKNFDATSIRILCLNLCRARPDELVCLFSATSNLERLECLQVDGLNASVLVVISQLGKLAQFCLNCIDIVGGVDEALECLVDSPCARSLRLLDLSMLSELLDI